MKLFDYNFIMMDDINVYYNLKYYPLQKVFCYCDNDFHKKLSKKLIQNLLINHNPQL